MKTTIIDQARADEAARLAVCLTNEIMDRTGGKFFDVDLPLATRLCRSFIEQGHYTVVAAEEAGEIIGFGTLCESRSLYAEGVFGIVQEFYVMPEYRSRRVGAGLMDRIVEYARSRGWKRLELCTPPVPEFDRTVKFYESNGFEITGGYKMKRSLG